MSTSNYQEPEAYQVVVILNPHAGRGKAGRDRIRLESLMRDVCSPRSISWQIVDTKTPGHGEELARWAVGEGASLVVAAGGDGTLNEVVNGIIGAKTVLGLLPMGTGNDFARCLGLSSDLKKCVELLFEGVERTIDIGFMEMPGVGGSLAGDSRFFLNIAGCGFDALVAARANRGFPLLRGTAAYLAAVAATLWQLKPANLTLRLDGVAHSARALMCSVANATSYGGGMRVAPDALLDDGLFDICLLHDAGRSEFIRAFPQVYRGTHTTHPRVRMYRASFVEIESDPSLPLLIDGEVIGTTPVQYRLYAGAIRIMAPR